MRERLRNLSCREIALGGAILVGWFFQSAEQAVGVALCLSVGFGVNALLNRIVDRGALDEDSSE
jgi:hypothetical protein